MAISLLLDSSGAVSGVSAETYIQAARQNRAKPEMRFSSVLSGEEVDIPFKRSGQSFRPSKGSEGMRASDLFSRANDFADSERLVRSDTSIAPRGIGLEKRSWFGCHWPHGNASNSIRNLGERLIAHSIQIGGT